jgi:flagellar motor switch protein FliM
MSMYLDAVLDKSTYVPVYNATTTEVKEYLRSIPHENWSCLIVCDGRTLCCTAVEKYLGE